MPHETRKILLVGYGEMGHAMEHLLTTAHDLDIWDQYPVKGRAAVDLESAAADADFVIYCVPANPIEELAVRILPALSDTSISLSIAKGLDDRGRAPARVFEDVYADRQDYGLIYGPMISEEIRAGRPAFAQLGVRDRAVFDPVAALFDGTSLYLEYTSDICGISWAAILKNIYAILFGVADGLGLGDNMRGYLAVASMHEMDAIVRKLGGSAATSHHLAGLGDLITTATSAGSHHHALGESLARGEAGEIAGEGAHALEMIRKYTLFDVNEYPLFRLVREIVDAPQAIEARVLEFLSQR